jgi:S-adenosylmethionine-dependent methyltransferase
MARTARSHGVEVEAVLGAIETLEATLAGRRFDLVCAHGLLMYLADGRAALEQLAVKARRGGLLSFTVRNGDALAYRPGLRGEWQTALSGFDTTDYVNELGAHATAHRLTDVQAWCRSLDLEIEAWYGVRVLTDGVSNVEQPDPNTLDECLRAEVEAGKRDPYRHLGSQLHFIARRA